MVDHGYDATVGAMHPGGTTVAIGGEVSGHLEILDHYWGKSQRGSVDLLMQWKLNGKSKNSFNFSENCSSINAVAPCSQHILLVFLSSSTFCPYSSLLYFISLFA